jgi:Epoxide hydrolase N terminus
MTAEPFRLGIAQSVLDDLQERLDGARWPADLDGPGWEDGTSSAWSRELVDWWRSGFDWRAQETAINRFANFHACLDGVRLHFVHERGRGAVAASADPHPRLAEHVL